MTISTPGFATRGSLPRAKYALDDALRGIAARYGMRTAAAILDLFSRFIVGWAVSAVNDRHLTIKALEMALKRRCPDAGLLHHSDQGSTYAVRTTKTCSTRTASSAA